MESITEGLNSLSLKENKQVVIFHHPDTLLHQSSRKHPQQPARVEAILSALKKYSSLVIKNMHEQASAPSTEEVEALAAELQGSRYLQFVQEMWDPDSKRTEMYINTDTYYSKYTYQSALAAAKTAIAATDYISTHKDSRSYAVIRPPGHHSGFKSQPHGFSFLNNIALSAHKAIKTKTASRVAIIDWDVHHGEGTQTIFYNRPDVLYISMHRYDKGKFFPHIPQSGSEFVGEGKGKGFNINIGWNLPEKQPGTTREPEETVGNQEYIHAFKTIVLPVLKEYSPELILVSCGFDSAEGDPIGGLKLSSPGYKYMLESLLQVNVPLGVVLEGGYNLEVLEWGSETVIKCLSQFDSKSEKKVPIQKEECNKIGLEGIENCLQHIRPFWKVLS